MKSLRGKIREKSVLLVENYYHGLAVSYISDRLGEDSLYLDELEKIKEEDRNKGRELYETFVLVSENETKMLHRLQPN